MSFQLDFPAVALQLFWKYLATISVARQKKSQVGVQPNLSFLPNLTWNQDFKIAGVRILNLIPNLYKNEIYVQFAKQFLS